MLDGAAPLADLRPLRVLQVGMEWFGAGAAGGAARCYADLFQSLPQEGIALTGLVSGPADVAARTGGQVTCFARSGSMPHRLLGARRAAGQLLRELRFDAVGCHFALYAAPMLDRLRGLPLVVHFHGPWAAESAREGQGRLAVALKRGLERLVYARAARVVVLSQAFAELAARDYGIPPARIRVVPGSVDLARFAVAEDRQQARARLGWPTDRPILLTVRRLAARMGIDRLLQAMPRVVLAQPDVLLHVAGTGPIAEALQLQCDALGLQDHVRFLGFLPEADLPLAYRAADINLVPSDALEGFGLSAAEALAAGTPSMVTPIGGLPEVVGALAPELVFRSGHPDGLADGLVAALSGGIKLPDAARCEAYAASRFDPVLCARRTAALYREVA